MYGDLLLEGEEERMKLCCLAASEQNQSKARTKLDEMRNTIEERTRHLKNIIGNQRQILAKNIDRHVKNLEQQ